MEQLAVQKNELAVWILSINDPAWLRQMQEVRFRILREQLEQPLPTPRVPVAETPPVRPIRGVEIKKELDIEEITRAQGNPRLTEEKLMEASKVLDVQGSLDEVLDQLK